MAPLQIEGDTLGQKHRNYNRKVHESKHEQIPEVNYEESDLDNLLKVDVACRNRDVDYVLRVFECEDLLYASRAIRRSAWLVTDAQFAHVVNPGHLHDRLAPRMMAKAFNKLLLHVRLHLKDERRVEEFFNYYKERDLKVALKWLPNCSVQLAESMIEKHASDIPRHLLNRLFEKSVTCLAAHMRSASCFKRDALAATKYYLRNHMDKYLDMIEACQPYEVPKIGPKATKLIMSKCSERVMKNIDIYASLIHVPTFARLMKQEDVKDFITNNLKNRKFRSWFTHSQIRPFINRLPAGERFAFVKEVFIDRKHERIPDDIVMYCSGYAKHKPSYAQSEYHWYGFAPFSSAFGELKKLVRSESNPSDRTTIFGVMLTCAGKDAQNVRALLRYYREHHINEPFRFKIHFANLVIGHTHTHRYDEETWGYLDDLFSSLDVYSENDRVVQNCVKAIILYNVLHGRSVPEVVEKKLLFDNFKPFQKKLSEEEKEKVFVYLYKHLNSKINSFKIRSKKDLNEAVTLVTSMLHFLEEWGKELRDFQTTLLSIKEIVDTNTREQWAEDVTALFSVKKSWRKLLFEQSIVLNPSQDACINALKHGLGLLETYKNQVEKLCLNENKLMDRFLKKVRIYWPQTLTDAYKDFFMSKLVQKNAHKAAIYGLCTLLPKSELTNLVQKYVPSEAKIDWTQPQNLELNLRKHIALSMHLARPQPALTDVLLYANGDYLQFALPSLNAVLYNMSSARARGHLPRLLDSPVSLQKHGIRIAFVKLKHDELKNMFFDIWNTNKNSSIRAAIFNQTLAFLCKLTEPTAIKEIWELLSLFIDTLTTEENKSIYTKLSKADNVPMSVRPEFWMKSFKFLKTLPPKANCEGLLSRLRNKMEEVMEFLDTDFVSEIFLESFEENFSTKRYDYQYLVVEFLLSTKVESVQLERYNKILVPIMEGAFAMWSKTHEDTNYVRENLNNVLMLHSALFYNVVLQKDMMIPVAMLTDVLRRLNEKLPIEEHYVLITSFKLIVDCVTILEEIKTTRGRPSAAPAGDGNENKFERAYDDTAARLGSLCVTYLKEDEAKYFPSIFIPFAKAFKTVFEKFNFNVVNKMNALKVFLDHDDFVTGYMFVLKALPAYTHEEREKTLKSELLKVVSAHPSQEVRMYYQSKHWLNST